MSASGVVSNDNLELRLSSGSRRSNAESSSRSVAEPGAMPFALLGRADFFKYFRITFEWHKKPPVFHLVDLEKAAARSRSKKKK